MQMTVPMEPVVNQLSVIVPVGPGEEEWRKLLDDLLSCSLVSEIIIVGTEERPTNLGPDVKWIVSEAGRAKQLNAGASASTGEHLWFLHADSRFTKSTLGALAAVLVNPESYLYYFDLQFAPDGPRLTVLNTVGARLRSAILGLPFGDQGYLLSRELFSFLGGFPDDSDCSEDYAFVWLAHRKGIPLKRTKGVITTSARKYTERGWLKTTWQHVSSTFFQAVNQATVSKETNQETSITE